MILNSLLFFRNFRNKYKYTWGDIKQPENMMFIFIFSIAVVLGIALFVAFRKNIRQYLVLRKAYSNDPLFKASNIHKIVYDYHIKVNQAWNTFDFKHVIPFLTDSIKSEWLTAIEHCVKTNTRYFASNPKIEEVNVLKVHDDEDNSKDSLVVEVVSKMIRYKYLTGEHIGKDKRSFLIYYDKYHLIRNGNEWHIDKVELSFMGLHSEKVSYYYY